MPQIRIWMVILIFGIFDVNTIEEGKKAAKRPSHCLFGNVDVKFCFPNIKSGQMPQLRIWVVIFDILDFLT